MGQRFGRLEIICFGGCSSLLLLLSFSPFFFLFSVWSLVGPEEIQNRLTGSHTRTHDEVDTRGSLVGCPRYAAVVVFHVCSFFLLFVIVPRSLPFRLLLVILGDPF